MTNDPFYIIAALIIVHVAREFFGLHITVNPHKPSWYHIGIYLGTVLLVGLLALVLADAMQELAS